MIHLLNQDYKLLTLNHANIGYRLGSRFCVNETSQMSERYSAQMHAAMKQKS